MVLGEIKGSGAPAGCILSFPHSPKSCAHLQLTVGWRMKGILSFLQLMAHTGPISLLHVLVYIIVRLFP